MKRFIVASGLLTALAISALSAPHAIAAENHATQSKSSCSGSCPHGTCPVKGASAVSAAAKAPGTAVASKGTACPVSDPSKCPSSCKRTQVSVSAKPAAKPNSTVIAAR
jgi:hypothetical protein